MRYLRLCAILVPLAMAPVITAGASRGSNSLKFHSDDPLTREPESQDASKVQEWVEYPVMDLAINLFGRPGDDKVGVRAGNVNTIDEVPDSSWFTNRIGSRAVSNEEALRASSAGAGVAPGPWTVVGAKEEGVAPGFTIVDAAGETWFVSFDAHGYPEAATGAILVATRIFWTLGYWQADSVLTAARPEEVLLGDAATVRPPSGKKRRMRRSDLDAMWTRAHRSPDGSYRAVASRRLPGRPLGGFRYHGTRPDDPNDIVPHEHRRELRALKVFGAWANLVDMKAPNTLDVLVMDGGRGLVRHYLQDVGSTFGTGALAPREYFEGWENLYEGDLVWKRLLSLGFFVRPWQTVPYEETAAIGRFEGDAFDPRAWKPRAPNAALRHAQPDDLFWAARRVVAFSDDLIRALAGAGGYSNPDDERHLADTLIKRRDKIAAAYLIVVNPVVDFALSPEGQLSFENAAVKAGVVPAGVDYRLEWAHFDNRTAEVMPIGETTVRDGGPSPAPGPLNPQPGSFVRVRVSVAAPPVADWRPVDVYFRRTPEGWTLVGVERELGTRTALTVRHIPAAGSLAH
jgi:hypothetical protein